jgi:hypothetical protein
MSKAVKNYAWGRSRRRPRSPVVQRIARVEQTCNAADQGRFSFYPYLEAIHIECSKLSMSQRAELKRAVSEDELGQPARAGSSIFLVLIRATTSRRKADHSRWGQALMYADAHRREIRKQGFTAFAEDNGGVAGMAREAATPQKKPRRIADPNIWED